jgi:ferredoxin-NADP reductase
MPGPVAERGADPKVPKLQRRLLNAIRAFTSPLLPDDYLELINPLWSTRELRGKIESIDAETPDAATVLIRPGYEWEGHRAGQYLRIGLDINGRRHWRAYSLTSDPGRPDGFISITIKNVDEGTVSPYLVRRGRPGSIVSLGGVEGEFVLPDPLPEKLLFISAGSGITPIMSMLRSLEHQEALDDVLLIHSARTPEDVIFGESLCPDWNEREAFISGPAELLDALDEHWDTNGDCDRLHMERFQPLIGGDAEEGEGGTIKFLKSDCEAHSDGSKPILVAGEDAGLTLPFGCREGICHTCVGELKSGEIRDLRTGKVSGSRGEMVRTCINAPEGPVEIEL